MLSILRSSPVFKLRLVLTATLPTAKSRWGVGLLKLIAQPKAKKRSVPVASLLFSPAGL